MAQYSSMRRWFFFFFSITIGVGLGLYYGWVINPVKYVDISPAALREDFRTDYVLMVAEAFQFDSDLELAVRRLAILGETPPGEIVRQAMIFAAKAPYAESDQILLSQLASALQAWNPASGASPP